jgi:hypothetical protein
MSFVWADSKHKNETETCEDGVGVACECNIARMALC